MSAFHFAVLHHTGWPEHADHYDLLLQFAGGRDDNDRVLKAFATTEDTFPAHGSMFKLNENHRRIYLNFEGPVSSDRGSLRLIDSGPIEWVDGVALSSWLSARGDAQHARAPKSQGLRAKSRAACPDLRFVIRGTKISGVCLLKIKHTSLYVLEKLSEIPSGKDL